MGTFGEVTEWSIVAVLKTAEPAMVPWVQIPPSPQYLIKIIKTITMDISSYQQDSKSYKWGTMIHFRTKLKTFVLRVPYYESDNGNMERVNNIVNYLKDKLMEFPLILRSKEGVYRITESDFISMESQTYRD